MAKNVICVSRTLASGGEEIARTVSERLALRYVDEEIVWKVAEKENVDVKLVAEAEHRQPLVTRILEAIGSSPVEMLGMPPPFLDPTVASNVASPLFQLPPHMAREHFRALIREVIEETAQEGNVVLVAHAAAIALAGREGLLRVLVTASVETRVARLRQVAKLDEAEAAKSVQASDKERREYLKLFYQIREELPTHYDLVINTDNVDRNQAAAIIAAAAGSAE